MLSKNKIKFLNSLKQKKFRDEHQLFIAEGMKIVPELLHSEIRVKEIFATEVFFSTHNLPDTIETTVLKGPEMEKISLLSNPNAVFAVCEMPVYNLNGESLKNKLTLILDDIKDPGNLGTIIRIADWFGIEQIICSSETVDVFNPKVIQSTMGSIARVRVHYTSLAEFFQKESSPGMKCFGALLEGENIYKTELPSSGLIVIGNESKGISEKLLPFITDRISIPSFSEYKSGGGEAESLNAAVAAAVICSEFRRRKYQA